MRRVSVFTISAATVMVLINLIAAASVSAQQPQRPLRPPPPAGLPVIPFMEGWYDNGDGSVTVSFGYHNRNQEPIIVPIGDANRIDPTRLGGMQPEIYLPGRHHGVFAVIIPASMDGETIWWQLNSADEELKVPGERGSAAYELDRNPRPQGSVQPLIGFAENDETGSGPEGILAAATIETTVDSPVTLEVWTEDPSARDRSDPRFAKPLDTRVSWYRHQGPGEVTFSAHESIPFIDTSAPTVLGLMPTPEFAVAVAAGKGPARVITSFSEPGDYIIRARLDNWRASDSDGLDQCCWSNAYQRVLVTE